MNIYWHELKALRKSTIVWTLSLAAIIIFFMSVYPSFTKDVEDFTKMLEGYPEPVRKAIGLDISNVFSLLGFYSYCLVYITLCAAIQAMNLGTSILSKEAREKTADFLMTKPVTRSKIMTSKILAAFTSLVFTDMIYFVVAFSIATSVATEDFSSQVFFMISITILFTQLIFFAIGLFLSVILSKIKSVLTVSLGTVFTFFIISIIVSTTEDDIKRYFTPFKYFDTAYIMEKSSYEMSFLLVGVAIVIAAITASYFLFIKKDIHAV